MSNSRRVYVTVYNETLAYGGPEEGGLYYQRGEPIEGVYTLCCGVIETRDYEDFSTGEMIHHVVTPPHPSDHAKDCPARGVAEDYHKRFVEGHKEEYLPSFTRRPDGVSWLDSDEDPPSEYRGEVATNGENLVKIELEPPENYPEQRPHYE